MPPRSTTTSRHDPARDPEQDRRRLRRPAGPGSVLTTFLLAMLLAAAPLGLGSVRLWYELPLLVGVALLLLVQGMRLSFAPEEPGGRKIDAIDLAVLAFTLYAAVRWLTSPTEYFSRLEALSIVAYAGIFFSCRYGLVRRGHGLWLVGVLVVLGVAETGFGYYLVHHTDWFPFGPTEQLHNFYAPRWVGTYGNPNNYACLLVMATGGALAFGCFSKLSWPLRIVCFYLAGMILIGVMFSISRGGWISLLGTLTALTYFGVRYGSLRWWIPPIGAVLVVLLSIGVVVATPALTKRVLEARDLVDTGLDKYVRVQLARDALSIARDYPAFGSGPGTFVFMHPRYQDATFAFKAELTHDDYMNCLADYGLVGFGLALFFVWAVTLSFFQPLRGDKRWQDRVLAATGSAAWCALLIHSLVDFNLHIPANALVFFALVGLGLRGMQYGSPRPHWSTFSLAPLGRPLGWALILFSLAYGFEAGRTAISDIIYEQAREKAQAEQAPKIQAILKVRQALAYDPANAQAWGLLGDLHRYRASREPEIEGRVLEGQQALDAYRHALKGNAIDDTIEARQGMTFDAMRRYSEAFFCYKDAIGKRPYDGQFWGLLGNHFWQRGLLEKAEEAFLIQAHCPHGGEGGIKSSQEVRQLLDAQGAPPAVPGANPLAPVPPPPPEPETLP